MGRLKDILENLSRAAQGSDDDEICGVCVCVRVYVYMCVCVYVCRRCT